MPLVRRLDFLKPMSPSNWASRRPLTPYGNATRLRCARIKSKNLRRFSTCLLNTFSDMKKPASAARGLLAKRVACLSLSASCPAPVNNASSPPSKTCWPPPSASPFPRSHPPPLGVATAGVVHGRDVGPFTEPVDPAVGNSLDDTAALWLLPSQTTRKPIPRLLAPAMTSHALGSDRPLPGILGGRTATANGAGLASGGRGGLPAPPPPTGRTVTLFYPWNNSAKHENTNKSKVFDVPECCTLRTGGRGGRSGGCFWRNCHGERV